MSTRIKRGEYYVEVDDIAPNQLATDVTVTVEKSGETLMTATYNVMSYGYNVLNATGDRYANLQSVIRALYKYYDAAAAYAA